MAGKAPLAIRAAVMNCLARCSDSDAPLCCLGEFLEKLGSMGWSMEDVRAVEMTVLHLLGKLTRPRHADGADARLAVDWPVRADHTSGVNTALGGNRLA
jgi:hypothetical protein